MVVESDIVDRLLLKRKRAPSLGGMRNKRPCTNPKGDTYAIHLKGSPMRPTLHFTDSVQLTGSPISWDGNVLDVSAQSIA